MKLIKPLYLSAALALALASCGTQKTAVYTPLTASDNMPVKVGKLAEKDLKRWSHLDLIKDTVPGMSVDRAYAELLKGKKSKKVIVGVVDSGVDIDHEDLKPVIWTNPKEVAGNGIDDDKNGYIDDIHGWNFLGKAEHENMEYIRILKKGDDGSETYKKAKAEYEKESSEVMQAKQQLDFILNASNTIKKHLKKDTYTLEDIQKIQTSEPALSQAKMVMSQVLPQTGNDLTKIDEFKDQVYSQVNYHMNLQFDGRKLVGDNPNDINDKKYGDNNVIGPVKSGAKHGTHVAGIIAQTRANGMGGDGVASNNVEILAVRAVPDGDEYDKDIALGIRYAVDNGAKVINGSFGKYFAQHPEWVYDAIKYAASKDVLIVVAAGNEGLDLNADGGVDRFPNDNIKMGPEIADNFLTVGALNYVYGPQLVADFSNYGKSDVDVFAPGEKIYATTPNQSYEYLQGTSMASPNVAGVAALIRSYYPGLTAAQVKQIIMDSGIAVKQEVILGGDPDNKRMFSEISKSGKMVNAYNALIMAEKVASKK
ncbi:MULTISPECIES: S8 family peptidase [Flavobacterium]|uniref:S8 family peptidase n=1 Tax=Flavobacterium TaxID=237 RepID=UPI00086D35B0|nr:MULTISPECIES: S8 family peptidase [Flavobacterium]MBN9285414.1 S8 family peptidase [Flavobacterium sp.]ODS85321.1 MAG: peptidase S8 [Chryseobacterium sp. SCN 40-13]OJV71693.1 MAG: peptidase S8 [Flavobacterium sp. 40-81]